MKTTNTPKIIAIGGGSMALGHTLGIDREIVRLTGKRRPRALFIPTASGDPADYIANFGKIYGTRLHCRVDVLQLAMQTPPRREISEKIRRADLIYVGGGNTLKMMKRWRRLGVDTLLRQAARRGAVLCGLSAGAICWFRWGSSDSLRYYDSKNLTLIRVKGLDLAPVGVSPHHIAEQHRTAGLKKIMQHTPGVSIALDDWCAIEIVGDRYRILSTRRHAHAQKIYRQHGKVRTVRIPRQKDFASLAELLSK